MSNGASVANTTEQKVVVIEGLAHKGVDNKTLMALLSGANVKVGLCPVVIDIVATKTAGKSSVYMIGEVDLPKGPDAKAGSMSALEVAAQGLSGKLQRARVTFSDSIIAELGLRAGAPVIMGGVEARIKVTEGFEPFYEGQGPIGYTDDKNQWVNRTRVNENGDDSPFYRDTQVLLESEFEGHSTI